ncbi:hypothetical protein SAMN06297251_13230 [Fulvimarina manganoxydans]|uniref:DUF937 domain-containing protein n=1 Tax=Fulvimarina manganoxydans TaxID=937218 RepID=A0A1W2ES41_9HYPH|nr:hypothetical protein [Fulvimarina manganoxydans]MEE2950102.1 hypothetical protein [Pseudomonadota bacterium]SMD12519.1 hypothetical protein SAMN06297251_13230 [Fulvimarina manganoxydans]
MTDFFDWLTTADTGLAADRLAKAYNLSHKELRETAQALAPAFALALQRTMANAEMATELAQQFAPHYGQGAAPSRQTAGNDSVRRLTETLFGSHQLLDAIARQVSSVTGTAPDTVEMLMRNLTLMTMQTTLQMAVANWMRRQPEGFATGDYPAAMAEMMRRGANALEALSRPSDEEPRRASAKPALSSLFANAFEGPLPWLPPMPPISPANVAAASRLPEAKTADETTPAFPPMPFLALFEGFAKGLAKEDEAKSDVPRPAPEGLPKQASHPLTDDRQDHKRPGSASSDRAGSEEDAASDPTGVGRLMRTGAEIQSDYLKRMTALFEANPPQKPPSDG